MTLSVKLCKTSLRYHKSPTVICAASFDMVLTPSLCIPQQAGSNLHVMSGPKRRLTSWVAPSKSSRLLSSNTSPKEPYRGPPHSAKDQMMLGQETTRVRSLTIQDLWYKWIVLAGFSSIMISFTAPKITALECLEAMAAGLYSELFTLVISLVNR